MISHGHLVRWYPVLFCFSHSIHNIIDHQDCYRDSIHCKWVVMLLSLLHTCIPPGQTYSSALLIDPLNILHKALHVNTTSLRDSDDRCLWDLYTKSLMYQITLWSVFLRIQLPSLPFLIGAGQEGKWEGQKMRAKSFFCCCCFFKWVSSAKKGKGHFRVYIGTKSKVKDNSAVKDKVEGWARALYAILRSLAFILKATEEFALLMHI